jgi:hypothetical protein
MVAVKHSIAAARDVPGIPLRFILSARLPCRDIEGRGE